MRGPKSIVHGHKAREYVIKVEKIENGNGNGNRAANEAFKRVLDSIRYEIDLQRFN